MLEFRDTGGFCDSCTLHVDALLFAACERVRSGHLKLLAFLVTQNRGAERVREAGAGQQSGQRRTRHGGARRGARGRRGQQEQVGPHVRTG
jgi:hypothetical protein